MDACRKPNCFMPNAPCDLGYLEPAKCPEWTGSGKANGVDAGPFDKIMLPWSGSAMGLVDLGFVSGRGKPIVIGVAGPENAGKTTLLACWYLLLGRGLLEHIDHFFAGSYTLEGWESVAGALRWDPGRSASFPPHTSSG